METLGSKRAGWHLIGFSESDVGEIVFLAERQSVAAAVNQNKAITLGISGPSVTPTG